MHLRPSARAELSALLQRAASDALSYTPAGCSLGGATPPGLTKRHWTTPLAGAQAFELAVDALTSWRMHRDAGLTLEADGPLAPGTNVAFSAPLPLGFVDGTCRIVAIVDEPDRFGFAYGTLSVHPERGEEAFLVVRDEAGNVRFDVDGVSRPARAFTRALSPIVDRLQDRAVRRYLSAMRRAASSS